jgi:hypothetical protein
MVGVPMQRDPARGTRNDLTDEEFAQRVAQSQRRRDLDNADFEPVIYNNGNIIVQAPGYVAFVNEMIHETRIIALDGRPHVGVDIKLWMGDSRGRFEGDTLVVETTNLTDRTGIGLNGGGGRHSDALKVTERFTRIDEDTIDYSMTIDDPKTWTQPWIVQFPLERDDDYGMYEYARGRAGRGGCAVRASICTAISKSRG